MQAFAFLFKLQAVGLCLLEFYSAFFLFSSCDDPSLNNRTREIVTGIFESTGHSDVAL